MKYSNSKTNTLKEKKRPQLVKYCEWEGCNNKGIYRAPKNRENLREFRWFCLKHVREYNKQWDYFSGLTQQEIENEIKKDNTWHLPTRPMGQNFYNTKLKDNMDILNKKENKNKNYDKKIKKSLNNDMIEAFKKLDLPIGASLIEIKKKYKKLVKKHHPDTNLNKNSSGNKLIEINEAYKILIDNYSI